MEKRALLAAILSLGVLYLWSVMFPPPKPAPKPEESSQISDIKEDTTKSTGLEFMPDAPVVQDIVQSAKTATMYSDVLTLDFTNIGGSLRTARLNKYDTRLPAEYFANSADNANLTYQQSKISNRNIRYTGTVNGWKVTKTYSTENDNLVFVEIEVQNNSKMSKQAEIPVSVMTLDLDRLDKSEQDPRERMLFEYALAAGTKTIRKHDAYKFSDKEKKSGDESVDWLSFRNKYFATAMKPNFESAGYRIVPQGDKKMEFHVKPKPRELQPGESAIYSFTVYAGPQDVGKLKSYDLGFENIVIYSNFGLIDGIAKFISWVIQSMNKVIPSWGICIILTSLLVYLVSYPLTIRGMSSMKKMQSLQPEMNALKEKHKSNPQKLNQEVVELYRKHKINPFGGCLMFLLQTPIFIGLYQVLWRSYFFKGESFLWIKDLSMPDRLFLFPFQLPVIGNEFNILPLIMAGVMFFQQKLSARAMVITDPAQQTQQKMMQIFFPIFLGFMFYHFASGLTIYFTMFYLLSTLTQFKMMKAK